MKILFKKFSKNFHDYFKVMCDLKMMQDVNNMIAIIALIVGSLPVPKRPLESFNLAHKRLLSGF